MTGKQPVLRGGSVTLRLAEARDVPAVMATANDPETQRWTPMPVFDLERAQKYVANSGGRWERGDGTRWVIADPDDECVGLFDLSFTPGDPGAGEVFFACAPTARGKGYMTEALRLAAGWALGEHGLDRLEWQALVGNNGSRRVAERAGFRYEGTMRQRCLQRGVRYDSWVASLLRDDLAELAHRVEVGGEGFEIFGDRST